MSDTQSIEAWIQRLPGQQTDYEPILSTRPSEKRKADQIASPPVSIDKMAPPRKRRIQDTGPLFDPDTTLRPKKSSALSTSISQLAASNTSSVGSGLSGTSSPKKQMMSLLLCDTGVEYKSLDDDEDVPDVAQAMFNIIKGISHSRNLLPDIMMPEIIAKLQAQKKDDVDWANAFKSPDDGDPLPGRIPSFEEVQKVFIEAKECRNYNHDEFNWNREVHLRLLEGIFREPFGKPCDAFNSTACTTARAHREFGPVSSSPKMIDLCIYALIDHDQELKASMIEFSKISLTLSVNHTDFQPIQLRPLLISIETKRPGVQEEKAQLQLGVWHAAQWEFLRWAVGQKLLRQRQAQGLEAPTTDKELQHHKEMKLASLSKLGFIPGLMVQGHHWYFVLSTYEQGKTKLWVEWLFGSTKGVLGIYQVIAGVRELTAWGRDVYLPWFKENILD